MYAKVVRVASSLLVAASVFGTTGCSNTSQNETESFSFEGVRSTVEIGHDKAMVKSALINGGKTNATLDELFSRMQRAAKATGFAELEMFSAGVPAEATVNGVRTTTIVHHVILRNPRDPRLTPMLFRLEGKAEAPPPDKTLQEGWLDDKEHDGPRVTFSLAGPLAVYADFQRGAGGASAKSLQKQQTLSFQLAPSFLLAKFNVTSLGFEDALGTSLRSVYGFAAPKPSQRDAIKAVAGALRRINEEAIR